MCGSDQSRFGDLFLEGEAGPSAVYLVVTGVRSGFLPAKKTLYVLAMRRMRVIAALV